jgi:aerotaxis receptor
VKIRPTVPLQKCRDFAVNEMFFSTTDAGGRILTGNEVFTRTSGYTLSELRGQPHNIVRHPDMPRAAFAVLWSNLRAGKSFNGYVKNLAKDGTYYWVFASISSLPDGRLLSIRFKPTTPEFSTQIPPLYAAALAAENGALAEGGSAKDATEAGTLVLTRQIQAAGFASYDEFAESALIKEMISRDGHLARERASLFPAKIKASEADAGLARLYEQTLALYGHATELFGALERIGRLSRTLRSEATSVIELADGFRLSALNSNIASSRFGNDGACISVIATFLTSYATGMTQDTRTVRQHLQAIADSTRAINASVAMARLELEMLLFFQSELARLATADHGHTLPTLEQAFLRNAARAGESIAALAGSLPPITTSRDSLAQAVVSIQLAQVRGLTEAARLDEADGLRQMFEEFRSKTQEAREEIDRISEVLAEFRKLLEPMMTSVAGLRGGIRV